MIKLSPDSLQPAACSQGQGQGQGQGRLIAIKNCFQLPLCCATLPSYILSLSAFLRGSREMAQDPWLRAFAMAACAKRLRVNCRNIQTLGCNPANAHNFRPENPEMPVFPTLPISKSHSSGTDQTSNAASGPEKRCFSGALSRSHPDAVKAT